MSKPKRQRSRKPAKKKKPVIKSTSIEDLYQEFRNTLETVAKSFCKKCGGNLEDVLSEATEHFFRITLTYKPKKEKVTLDTKLRKGIMWSLMDTFTKDKERNELMMKAAMMQVFRPDNYVERKFDINDFLSLLTENAKAIVRMVFHTPKELQEVIDNLGEPNPSNIRQGLFLFLKKAGWSMSTVTFHFSEIRDKLHTYSK